MTPDARRTNGDNLDCVIKAFIANLDTNETPFDENVFHLESSKGIHDKGNHQDV